MIPMSPTRRGADAGRTNTASVANIMSLLDEALELQVSARALKASGAAADAAAQRQKAADLVTRALHLMGRPTGAPRPYACRPAPRTGLPLAAG
jgi:hypothetical protein